MLFIDIICLCLLIGQIKMLACLLASVTMSDLAKSSMTRSVARSLCDSWASCTKQLLVISFTLAIKRRRTGVAVGSCPFFCASVRRLPNLWKWYFENDWTDFVTNRHKWSTGQGHGNVNFRGQEVKDQSHRRPKIDLEAWRRHRLRPLWVDYLSWLILCRL